MKTEKFSKLYPIICLSKEDIIKEFNYNCYKELIIKKVNKLTNNEMIELASLMVDQFKKLYWVSLRAAFESKYMEEIENEPQTRRK